MEYLKRHLQISDFYANRRTRRRTQLLENVIQINESRWNLMVIVKEILVMNNTWDLNTIITIYYTFEGEVVVLRRDTVYDLIQYRYPELEYPVKFFTEESIKVCLPEY